MHLLKPQESPTTTLNPSTVAAINECNLVQSVSCYGVDTGSGQITTFNADVVGSNGYFFFQSTER